MAHPDRSPNVVIIYADDLGFGDVGCYGATDLPTPNLDRLAAEGVRFEQGYATASTCTPSRYSLLTGSYPFRNPRAAILRGTDGQIIERSAPTLPQMFRNAGYRTGIVGKWHLGIGDGSVDWNSPHIDGTPNDVGFDESYILAATNDRTPCIYIDNHHVDGLDPADPIKVIYGQPNAFPEVPTQRSHPELCKIRGHAGSIINGYSRLGVMRGGKAAIWDDETMSDVFLGKSLDFIDANRDDPFFLYYALHQPHAPRIPGPRFAGKSPMGPRGDVIIELDCVVGQVLDKLEGLGLLKDTIVVFSSDNGPVLWDQYEDNSIELAGDHRPAGPLRGGKYSSFDGGTRVPTILSWPGAVEPGVSDALVCQVDLYASFAALLDQPLSDGEAPDSENVLDAWLGRSEIGRDTLLVEGNDRNTVFRRGSWSYIPPHDGPALMYNGIELGNDDRPQLYDLSQDIGQIRNVADERPEKLAELDNALNELLQSSHSRTSP